MTEEHDEGRAPSLAMRGEQRLCECANWARLWRPGELEKVLETGNLEHHEVCPNRQENTR